MAISKRVRAYIRSKHAAGKVEGEIITHSVRPKTMAQAAFQRRVKEMEQQIDIDLQHGPVRVIMRDGKMVE
jgi:hypothetical protein